MFCERNLLSLYNIPILGDTLLHTYSICFSHERELSIIIPSSLVSVHILRPTPEKDILRDKLFKRCRLPNNKQEDLLLFTNNLLLCNHCKALSVPVLIFPEFQ